MRLWAWDGPSGAGVRCGCGSVRGAGRPGRRGGGRGRCASADSSGGCGPARCDSVVRAAHYEGADRPELRIGLAPRRIGRREDTARRRPAWPSGGSPRVLLADGVVQVPCPAPLCAAGRATGAAGHVGAGVNSRAAWRPTGFETLRLCHLRHSRRFNSESTPRASYPSSSGNPQTIVVHFRELERSLPECV